MNKTMTNKLWVRKPLLALILVATVFLAFCGFHIPPAPAVFRSEDVFFEYGAEYGVLQPPWDIVGPMGSGDHSGSSVTIDTAHVRSGSKAIKFYQVPPTKDDAQRRVELHYYNTKKEFYVSWWAYFPSGWENADSDWGQTIGGWQSFFGPPEDRWKWWTGGRFGISKSSRTILFSYAWGKRGGVKDYSASAEAIEEMWSSAYDMSDCINQWVHFQTYVKWAKTNTGVVTAWINNELIANKTNLKTDPEGYSEWDSNNCAYQNGRPYPFIVIEQYGGCSSPERWYWVDDIIGSDKKVIASYGVDDPSLEFESWENGFESGDFSAWNGTQFAGSAARPTITSEYSFTGTYSANFTTDGSDDSYAIAMHIIQNTTAVFQRSYARFEELPDANNTRLMVLRTATESGIFIASVGVYRMNSNYYWCIDITGSPTNPPENYTQATINTGTWYNLEFYFNSTTNGNATLWVNNLLQCETVGDFSSFGEIARVYPYLYVEGAQFSSKTVYHDNFAVDTERIYAGGASASRIDVTAEPNIVSRDGGISQITVQLKDVNSQTVAQSGVTITVETSSWTGPSSKKPTLTYTNQTGYSVTVTTDPNGQATITLTAQGATGIATIIASTSGELSSDNTVVICAHS